MNYIAAVALAQQYDPFIISIFAFLAGWSVGMIVGGLLQKRMK